MTSIALYYPMHFWIVKQEISFFSAKLKTDSESFYLYNNFSSDISGENSYFDEYTVLKYDYYIIKECRENLNKWRIK